MGAWAEICGAPSSQRHAAPFPGALLGAEHLPQTPSLALFRESCFGVCGVVKKMNGSSTLLGYQPWARRGTVNSPLRSPGLGKREPSVAIPGTDGLNYLTLKGQQDGGLGWGWEVSRRDPLLDLTPRFSAWPKGECPQAEPQGSLPYPSTHCPGPAYEDSSPSAKKIDPSEKV